MTHSTLRAPLLLLAGAAIGCAASGRTEVESRGTVAMASTPNATLELKQGMRRLWSDHVVWTRNYIVAAADGHASAQAASARLLRNQEDIGKAVVPYFGEAGGTKLTDLLKQHILIAVDLVAAAKAGDTAKQSDADAKWTANAADIATFLSEANEHWPKQTLLDMLNEHLSLTKQEAVARLQSKWDEDVVLFDKIHTQAMLMADALTDGIVRKFPTMF
jgi:hypothetical protein